MRCTYCHDKYDPDKLTSYACIEYPGMCPRCIFIAIDIKFAAADRQENAKTIEPF